jgi:hypothetical protein
MEEFTSASRKRLRARLQWNQYSQWLDEFRKKLTSEASYPLMEQSVNFMHPAGETRGIVA